jgi:hypothetical protein
MKFPITCFLSVRGRSFECFDCVVKQSSSACNTALECELKLTGHGIQSQRIHVCYYILYHQVRRNTMDPVDRRDWNSALQVEAYSKGNNLRSTVELDGKLRWCHALRRKQEVDVTQWFLVHFVLLKAWAVASRHAAIELGDALTIQLSCIGWRPCCLTDGRIGLGRLSIQAGKLYFLFLLLVHSVCPHSVWADLLDSVDVDGYHCLVWLFRHHASWM